MKQDLIKDVATLTTLGAPIMNKVAYTERFCICDYIQDAIMKDEDLVEISTGYGTLSILILEDEIKYSFKPSRKLEKEILQVVEESESPIYNHLSDRLLKRLESAYKDIF